MTIYWLLFAIPAFMALTYPLHSGRGITSLGQNTALLSFVIFYAFAGALRFETGGDWETYQQIFDEIRYETLGFAMVRTDPAYGLLNWLAAQIGWDIYLVNGLCCLVLGYGVISAAKRLREPWLALVIAVPYLLIVVGMGYVRQGAAIGMMLLALSALDRSRTIRAIICLLLAVCFHSAAAIALPLFALGFVQRNKAAAVLFIVVGVAAYFFFLAPRLDRFEAGYITAEYESSGALPRIMMGLVPAVLLLLRWKHFPIQGLTRPVWLTIALGNILALVALALSPSSTAVDRVALFVSVIQLAAFAEIRDLTKVSDRMTFLLRVVLIGVAGFVQVIWLVFATHAGLWVPYISVFDG